MYRVKIAAINSIGQGEWSNTVGLYSVGKPTDPSNFLVTKQSEQAIEV